MTIAETVQQPEEATGNIPREEQPERAEQEHDQERGRSTIQFPYLDLNDAVEIATGVHEVGGNNCQIDQLAAHFQQKSDAPKFRQKLSTSKMFGLISYGQGTVALTSLGKRACDPQTSQQARVEAFLNIALYNSIYEQYKGGNLPPLAALETAMENLGVAPKQKRNARLAFQRSATQAGYFAYGTDRLVKPPIKNGGGTQAASSAEATPLPQQNGENPVERKGGGDGGDGGSLNPFIQGLIKILPPEKSEWPLEKRAKWLQAASNMLDLVYEGNDGTSTIEIKVRRESAS